MTNLVTLSRPVDRLLKTATNDEAVSGFVNMVTPVSSRIDGYVGLRSGSLAYAVSHDPGNRTEVNGRTYEVRATLWSYGAAIATIVVDVSDNLSRRPVLVLLSDGDGYNITTNTHITRARTRAYQAFNPESVANAPADLLMPVENQITSSLANATDRLTAALRARHYPGYKLASYEHWVLNARKLAAFFNFEQYVDAPAPHRVPGTLNAKQTAKLVALRLNGTAASIA